MSSQPTTILTVHPPIPYNKLGKYRHCSGVFIVRHKEQIIYVGNSNGDICRAIYRLFQHQGKLASLDKNRLWFEIVLSTIRRPPVRGVLVYHFKPEYNYIKQGKLKLSKSQKAQAKRILKTFSQLSRFENQGEHKSDREPLNNAN